MLYYSDRKNIEYIYHARMTESDSDPHLDQYQYVVHLIEKWDDAQVETEISVVLVNFLDNSMVIVALRRSQYAKSSWETDFSIAMNTISEY